MTKNQATEVANSLLMEGKTVRMGYEVGTLANILDILTDDTADEWWVEYLLGSTPDDWIRAYTDYLSLAPPMPPVRRPFVSLTEPPRKITLPS